MELKLDYQCNCPAGFEGTNCETNTNECSSNPCLNGGTCDDQINGYTCHCAAGFIGSKCEIEVFKVMRIMKFKFRKDINEHSIFQTQ